ncbi:MULTISPECIES: DUF4232 domain-containing protein [unclassified Streptomyces]|uniref:DUF4232 domain-containing protein n=1 Tax=Streptomyces TaxID=1883 RepID=UPI0001C18EC2|nr:MULTISPECIES: DUF4232 domain-containing protein [unclassified Streptomyces]AEN09253.1 conserved hypothetical protein [Streptomyces sp. SirexAA-E]MYR70453.1 DUF4232 domain-containing protein [Streptomyces sp. SID4939]MYS02369.1 DUF4232 domain-containing protein [Streptomyces sp. SID4940]MYT64887.1 DUF4232 domain-containing protein [Streptomyces sp. SID8357]MYT87567.1 DUF4232 domain-containing protein [Streptomyces sp. SID8360]
MRVRHTTAAVLCSATVLTLSGCAGFLVPAGEGEPAPTRSPAQASAPSGTVRAETLPAVPDTTSAPPRGAPGTTAPAGDCPASGAKVEMGPVEAAMFHRAVVLTLTNCGTGTYQVNGYPAVRALDEDGRRIPVPVNPGGSMFGQDQGPKAVALEPGGTVRSILAWVSTQEGGDLIEGDALEIAAAPDAGARIFPLEEHDVRLMDELNTTAWRADLPE